MTKSIAPVAAAALLVVAVAGCGSSSKKSASTTSTPATSSTSAMPKAAGTSVALRKVSFGKVLVGSNGRTLYLFEKDKGTTSKCTGKCAGVWAPLTTQGQPQAGAGTQAALFGTTKRPDGTTQVTYGGHPLYFYDDDKRPGMTEGEGSKAFGAEWYAVGPTGKKVEKAGS
jgi:predicted lipoprotein with Yx(FWY)xxD motif